MFVCYFSIQNDIPRMTKSNSIGVKYSLSLIALRGGFLHHVFVLTSLLFCFFNFEFKLQAFVMTKAVSNMEICFIKAALTLRENGHFF